MPEGDTIHRAANRLRPALVDGRLTRFEARHRGFVTPATGTRIEGVRAVGKHLLVDFADGVTLRTHMRMTGSWHLYRATERWRRPAHLARVVIGVDSGWVAVCFAAPVVETYLRTDAAPDALAALGPDLCTPTADIDEAVRRLGRLEPDIEIADALLDQRVACGVGNVYKSETLFVCRVDPFARIGTIDEPTRRALLTTAHELLLANLGRADRITYRGGLGVYGRRRQPCRRCGDLVRSQPQGPFARLTYWCPGCQPSVSAEAG